jgi:hypothetical protein
MWKYQEPGLVLRRAIEHVYPPQSSMDPYLSAPVPASYMMQWFFKDTWNYLPQRLEKLQLPTIHQQADVYIVSLIHGEESISVLYVKGRNQSPWYEREIIECRKESHSNRTSPDTDDLNPGAMSHKGSEEFALKSTSTCDDSPKGSLTDIMRKMELEPKKRFRWPTEAADVIALYKRVWRRDVQQAKQMNTSKQEKVLGRYEEPHFYSNLTRMCCPTIQIDTRIISMPQPDTEVAKRYEFTDCCRLC